MKSLIQHTVSHLFLAVSLFAVANEDPPTYPGQDRTWQFHDAAGTADTTALWKEDASIVAWATGYQDLQYGSEVDAVRKTPAKALGVAGGGSYDIVCLGRGGQITLTFDSPIRNGEGFDFAVFENSFSDHFLELGYVEVSSDGVHFVRFPNFSYTPSAVGGFGAVNPSQIHGLAGKYKQGYGTPFDLEQLHLAYTAVMEGSDSFDAVYQNSLVANFQHLDLDAIQYLRIIDIPGDGSAVDCEGAVIYDPYPTVGSAGFDLDAVAVLHQQASDGLTQSIDFAAIGHQIFTEGGLELSATASSGLPVNFELLEGPAQLEGAQLSFTGLGSVVVQATQLGDASYAPAVPVTHSFVVADALQHIYLEPIANQLVAVSDVAFYAQSSSGLPVELYIDAGPEAAYVHATDHLFSSGSVTGSVTLRASLPAGAMAGVYYAPAEDVFWDFEIVSSGAPNAARSFAAWQLAHGLAGTAEDDADADGASDFEEYVAGSDPNLASDHPDYRLERSEGSFILVLNFSKRARARVQLMQSTELTAVAEWTQFIPEMLSIEIDPSDESKTQLRFKVPQQGGSVFWKFSFSED